MADSINKFQRDLGQTENTFKFEPKKDEPKKNVAREEQVRRDTDVVKAPNADIHQIDYNIKWFLDNVIKPTVDDGGKQIIVPTMYASPEKWSSIQGKGFMRDDKGKIMTPVIAYSRTNIDSRSDMPKLDVFDDEENRIRFSTKYTSQNKYDKFSVLMDQIPQEEYYSVPVPEYITVNYDFIVWTDYVAQLNKIIENILVYQGTAWGDTYKYLTSANSFNFETTNASGEDRISKSTFTLKVLAYVLPNNLSDRPNIQKHHTKAKIVIGEGTYDPNNPFNNTKKSSEPNLF